jgi:hypothetical protein
LTSNSTQLSAATALVQLLQEHPELHAAEWSFGSTIPALHGFLYRGDMAALAAYADVIGGSIGVDGTYEDRGTTLQRHTLKTVWRDVRVEIVVSLPVAVEAAQVAA